MTTRHTLVGERVNNPSHQQIRKIVGKAHKVAGFQMKPDYLYTVVRAISARVNQNYDGWPSDELKKAAHTFVGKPVFVNHENFDTDKARGVVVAARYCEAGQDKYIETVMEIDAKRFPLLAKEIKTGGLDSVSMGAEAGFTICSACGNQAYDEPDMCDHVKFHKGEKLHVRNRRTGKVEEKLVYESCHKLSFFELSYVFDPADETAVASKVVMGSRKHIHGADCAPGDTNCHGWGQAIEPATGGGGGDKAPDMSKVQLPSGGGGADRAALGTPGGGAPSKDLTEALQRAGVDPAMYPMLSGFAAAEGNNPGGAPTLGFTDSQAGTTLDSHAQALSKQIKDRASVSGEFPTGGTPAEQASWMATTVGQNGSTSDWQGNAQPARSDYVDSIVNAMPASAPASTASPVAVTAPSTPTTVAPTQRSAGFKDWLHPPSPESKFPPVEGDHPGASQGWSYDPEGDSYSHPSGNVLHPSDEQPGTHQLWTPTVTMGGPHGLAKDRQPHSDLQRHFDEVQRTGNLKTVMRRKVLARLAGATDDYLRQLEEGTLGGEERELPTGPATGQGPSKSMQQWLQKQKRGGVDEFEYPPNENSQKTQVSNTGGTYDKAHAHFDAAGAPQGQILDYGAGLGHSSQYGDTFEPHPRAGFTPTHQESASIPDGSYHRVTNLNVLNVVPPSIRDHIVSEIGRVMAPGGHAVITTRGRDVMDAKGKPGPEPMSMVVGQGGQARYQKGFTRPELHQYVQQTLGPDYHVTPVPLGPAGVHIVRKASRTANLKEALAVAIYRKLAFGEVEAPPAVDTLREEGSAPEDDNDDFHQYVEAPPDSTDDFANRVDSPADLRDPDLSEASQIDRAQEEEGTGMDDGQNPAEPGQEDPSEGGQFMVLKIPVPPAAPAAPAGPPPSAMPMMPPAPQPMPPGGGMPPPGAPAAPPTPGAPQAQVPMQAFGSVSPRMLAEMERVYGYRLANWRDAIEADRDFTPEERADYIREAAVVTLEKSTADSPTSRNPVKGTANMARSTLATRRSTAGTRHFAEGPLTDGGDVSRNDQGEQEEAFITETPAFDSTHLPDDDETNISNTEGNLVADEAYAHSLTSKLQQQRRELEATAREYARVAGVRKRADEYAGGPTATEVNPTVPTSAAEELTGDHFTSADPDPAVDTSPGGDSGSSLPHESSLQAFRAFDKWLTATTKRSTRNHSEANIKKAAAQFANYNGIPVQAMFPALGIALRQARKTEAALKAKKGSTMRKRAVDLETAAPDERISVPAPVADTTDAEAQASQFHEDGYANNAGDNLAKPDQSTGQNFAPGQAPGKSAAKADGILAIRCAEAMIAAGLEPNTRERKYQLAAEFSKMSRGLILDRTALAERFAMVRHADRQVASGSTRGAARSPIPAGLGQGGTTRSASVQRVAAQDPDNDALLYG